VADELIKICPQIMQTKPESHEKAQTAQEKSRRENLARTTSSSDRIAEVFFSPFVFLCLFVADFCFQSV